MLHDKALGLGWLATPTRILFMFICVHLWFRLVASETPPEQPIPYSHKTHAAIGLACRDCHAMPSPGKRATFPAEAQCMACHTSIKSDSPAIQKLAQYYKEQKAVPWVRVYQVPDYVYFSHKVHLSRDGVTCEACHGPVGQRDVVTKEKGVDMASCMFCHDEYRVPIACNGCHE